MENGVGFMGVSELEVLRFLLENQGASLRDISGALGVNVSVVRGILYRLRNKGLVERLDNKYFVTMAGRKILEATSGRAEAREQPGSGESESVVLEPSETPTVEPAVKPSLKQGGEEHAVAGLEGVLDRVLLLEKKVGELEKKLAELAREVEGLRKSVEAVLKRRENVEKRLPKPVMTWSEAEKELGDPRSLVYAGKAVMIGSLLVDPVFYRRFKSRFPLPLRDVEKLDPLEKQLLEELRREGRAYLHAGREYRLVE